MPDEFTRVAEPDRNDVPVRVDGTGRNDGMRNSEEGDRRPEADRPHRGRLVVIAVIIVVALAVLFVLGYLPRKRREHNLEKAAETRKGALAEVGVVQVKAAPSSSNLILPGNITPLTEAVISARADGYLKRRFVDIGDHVRAGQVLAEIESPELDQQVQQGRANLSQTRAALSRAEHALTQAQANLHLAEVTVQRWKTLADRGVVSRQEYDQKQADYQSQAANVQSSEADIRAAQDNVRASEANLQRLINLQSYERVTAPFSGIVTARTVDVGALISSNGNTPLFRIAQSDILRIMVDVPEQSAPYIHVGQPAEVTLQEFAGRKFMGRISRTANSLDPAARTLPTEVQVPNRDGALMPNMFAEVTLISLGTSHSIMIPGDTLVVRPNGTQVAVIEKGNRIHFQPVELGRDYGPQIEVRSGLTAGQYVVTNPTDDVREGVEVNPVVQKAEASPNQVGGQQTRPAATGSGAQQSHPGPGAPERPGAQKR
jgi:RND family efflux transporter MFP subunit